MNCTARSLVLVALILAFPGIGLVQAQEPWDGARTPEPDAEAAPLGPEEQARRIQELGAEEFRVREAASVLLARHPAHLPALAAALDATEDAEVAERLRRLIDRLGRTLWHDDLETARAEARRLGRPLLVFSTIGTREGFA